MDEKSEHRQQKYLGIRWPREFNAGKVKEGGSVQNKGKLENLIMLDNMSGTKIGQEPLLFVFWNEILFYFFSPNLLQLLLHTAVSCTL